MSDIAEGLGTAAEGGLLARAVEPETGADKPSGHPDGENCLNCGTELIGAHCHACGQKGMVHRSLSAIGHEIMHGVLHLDGKIWRTLPLLVFKPGKLTRRYIDGERASFVGPMAMFLFSVFLMFAVFQIAGIGPPSDLNFGDENKASLVEAEQKWIVEQKLRAERIDQFPADSPQREAAEEALIEAETNLREVRSIRRLLDSENADQFETDSAVEEVGERDLRDIPWVAKLADKWTENPSLMLYKLQANGYKFSWLLIPLSIPFVWLLFAWKRRFKAYDHAVFVTYSLAFMSGLFIALSLVNAAGLGGGWVFLGLAVIPPIHLYKHLRHTYELSRFGTLWRVFVLMFVILIVCLLFFQALLLIGTF